MKRYGTFCRKPEYWASVLSFLRQLRWRVMGGYSPLCVQVSSHRTADERTWSSLDGILDWSQLDMHTIVKLTDLSNNQLPA
jgi:hypothetical protein